MVVMVVMMVALVSACEPRGGRLARWPDHRHQHDDQLASLLELSKQQARVMVELAQRIVELEARVNAAAVALPQPAAP